MSRPDSTQEIERKVERHTRQQLDEEHAAMQAEEAQRQAQQQNGTRRWRNKSRRFGHTRWIRRPLVEEDIIRHSNLWRLPVLYSHGFGPQFLTQETWPGPGNNSFNAFDITQAYLDFKFTPVDDFSARVTPNMYETINTGTTCTNSSTTITVGTPPVKVTVPAQKCTASSGDKVGASTGWAQTIDRNLSYRLKYAYIDYNTFFKKA